MAKPSKKPKKQNDGKEITVAKYGLRGTIVVAVLGLIGTIVTAYFGFLANRQSPTDISVSPSSTNKQLDLPVSQTSLPTIHRDYDTGYLIVYPSCNCEYNISLDETVFIRLRWGAKTLELAEQGANLVSYSLIIDSQVTIDLENYRKPAVLEEEPVLSGDLPETWWVYWDYPVKFTYPAETHIIQSKLNTLAEIDNGWNVIPSNFIDISEIKIESIYIAHKFQCDDGKDNDRDGLIDWPNDPGCKNKADDNESN